ncbi:rhodanese-like domain-containing protein [Brachybacterium sp. AOP25-B2-12]|uniref:rhodanese-like domain-containing protein n=1 Tax=Brachybacterium sp. AOP25-B2-12 TaxID=3457710 RepID=UPI004034A3DD
MTATHENTPEILHEDTLISPEQAVARQQDGALLIDVRSAKGQAQDGLIAGAVPVAKADAPAALDPRSHTRIPELSGDLDQEVVVFCGSEAGSDPIVDQLRTDGYRNVHQIAGGVTRWLADGLPTTPVEDASDATA